MVPTSVEIFDTTLRDGAQFEGISLTVEDKLRIAEQLDWLGVSYIEAGWPGANPKDDELFRRAPDELKLDTSILVAFGSTRRPKGRVDSDDTLSRVYHELKWSLASEAALLVAPVAATPKLRGVAPGTLRWLRQRTSPPT